ncbi:hypothetical protein FRC06_002777 [Ceratobasidium sp. 370]|nr:hypothetical protein FRC06_002777 [Ceratobasidium sp. 370]
MAEANSAIIDQLLRQCDELRAKGARFDQAMEELTKVNESAPRWEDGTLKDGVPVAGSSVERWKTEMRARENLSPPAHRGSKRSGGLSLGGMVPKPESLGSRAQYGVPRASGSSLVNDPEATGSTGFHPAGTSTPVRVRQAGKTFRGWSGAADEKHGPIRSNIAPSFRAGSSLLREPLPPRSPGYVSFGSPVDMHLPRPNAPEPDRTLSSSSSSGF